MSRQPAKEVGAGQASNTRRFLGLQRLQQHMTDRRQVRAELGAGPED